MELLRPAEFGWMRNNTLHGMCLTIKQTLHQSWLKLPALKTPNICLDAHQGHWSLISKLLSGLHDLVQVSLHF